MADELAYALYFIRYIESLERRAIRQERVFRDRENPFDLSDSQFMCLFRLPKNIVSGLIQELRGVLQEPQRSNGITVETKVLTALRFYAHGSFQHPISQERNIALSQPSVSRCITAVSQAIAEGLLAKWVRFPSTEEEVLAVKTEFMNKFKFPGVVGVIDCTHVAIRAPTNSTVFQEHEFVNRKLFHSINVQMVCDSQMRIININARFPGSAHDAFIWRSSTLRHLFQDQSTNGILKNAWLIGDSGYPLEPWLLTPVGTPAPEQQLYNSALSRVRNTVECQFGLIKSVWRCISKHRVLNYNPDVAGNIVVSCAVLHNMFVQNNMPFPDINDEMESGPSTAFPTDSMCGEREGSLHTQGRKARDLLIRNHFTK